MSKSSAPVSRVRQLISDAKLQNGFIANVPPGFVEATSYMSKPAAASAVLSLNAEMLPALMAPDGQHVTHAPFAPVGAATMTLAATIAATSRISQAGAHLIFRGEQDEAVPTGLTGIVAMQRAVGAFATIEAAPFATVPDDVDLSVSAFPVARAALDWSQSISKGVRFELPRSMQKAVGEDQLANELLLGVALGIARAADEVLLSAIATSGGIAVVMVDAGGSGYVTAPTVAFAGGGGSGATATASVSGGAVTSITVTNPGAGYTSAPTINLSGGSGADAEATASLVPATFSLAAAAARGLKFEELRALIGTAGTGAAVGHDGALRAAGVAAELTSDTADTLIGSFARSAVAIHDDVRLHFERRNTKGDLVATAWVQFIPLLPDATAFWQAA